MAVVVLFDPEAAIPLQVQWALWFAESRREALTLLLPRERREVAIAQARAVVEAHTEFVFAEKADEGGDEQLRCRALDADPDNASAVLEAIGGSLPNLFVVLLSKLDPSDARAAKIGRDILPNISCGIAVVRLGERETWPLSHLAVAASRGAHPRAALRLAQQLASSDDGRVTGVYVEPDIGSDAKSVGANVLGKVLRAALDEPDAVKRHVVIDGDVDAGLQRACEELQPDAVVLAMPSPGLLGNRFWRLVPARLSKRIDLPVVIIRQALPLGNRLRRWLQQTLRRFVPQVERDTRVELATRVQSSSAWNFDFVALISLSTIIAALGLLQNSAAVIIGAMLIAPLMTPILGLGLSLAQGNTLLLKLAFRSVFYGVGTAFVLAALVGWIDGTTHPSAIVTEEMLARGWPGLMDLGIAFVSGLAAAYAHSRPGLVAALPGVAIAAALVPPIATSGLAFAGGKFELAYGSLLLFFTNMVTIVLAAGLSLWAVGVRKQRGNDWPRHVGNALILVTVLLSVYLTQRPHRGASVLLAPEVREAIERELPERLRLVTLQAGRGDGDVVVTVQLGGNSAPDAKLAQQLRRLVAPLVAGPVRLRLTYEWEALAEPSTVQVK